ncbi:hypothetical protein LJC49_00940 [Ruminococcaceae bacterium OttesenSCG-928-I18]|nr:hypothetical protein [Ruminococcaceae bacterium OttesenSCG-928-I18]
MSKAFVQEGEEWGFCREKREHCLFVREDGSCRRKTCVVDGSKRGQGPKEEERQNEGPPQAGEEKA